MEGIMNRLLLYLPVGLLGAPLLTCLMLNAAPSGQAGAGPVPDEPPPALAAEGELPDAGAMEKLARKDPIGFLENCVRKFEREVKGYTATFLKQERINGKLYPKEVIELHVREKPWSVHMRWTEGARKAGSVLYISSDNPAKMLVHPAGLAGRLAPVVERDVASEEAKESGRYTVDKSGIKNATLRTLASLKAAQKKGTLQVEFLGEQKVQEAGNRLCYRFHRTYTEPEYDGVMDLTYFIDKETWLQVGSIVKGKDNKLLGEYFFRDIRLNPKFEAKQFQREALLQ
jgi:hypothetical protein